MLARNAGYMLQLNSNVLFEHAGKLSICMAANMYASATDEARGKVLINAGPSQLS
jgi:hypothetical protein